MEEWINNQRKNASKKIQRFYREKVTADGNAQRTGGVAYGVVRTHVAYWPIANERLRVKTAVMRADQLLAQGVDEEYEAEMEESRYFIVPSLQSLGQSVWQTCNIKYRRRP